MIRINIPTGAVRAQGRAGFWGQGCLWGILANRQELGKEGSHQHQLQGGYCKIIIQCKVTHLKIKTSSYSFYAFGTFRKPLTTRPLNNIKELNILNSICKLEVLFFSQA